MKFKRNLLILSAILIGILIVVAGCLPPPTTPPAEGDVPTNGTISVAAAAATTNDTTPTLTLSSTGATYMAFSGNGTTWSSWVTYATTYSAFNITTGEGCTSGDGTKTVYAKYKNDNGESATKVHDSILLDTVKPTLLTAVYTDVGSGGTVNASDTIVFTFDDEMDITTVTASTVKANLLLSASKSYGTSPTVSWDSTLKICTVTLGASPTLIVGTTTVNPSVLVKDTAGNTDNSTAVTISGTVLSSVTISPTFKTYIEGDVTTTTFTAVAKNAAGTNITSLCTFAWSESGFGAISPATGSSTVYTPVATGTGTNNITVSATYLGVTKTKIAIVTITAATPSSTDPDPTKLSISGKTDTAKYTSLPSGATVKVYSHVTNSASAAAATSAKATITLNNEDTAYSSFTAGDYIFFMIFYSDDTTSSLTADGRLPSVPNADALAAIQAINKNTVTSTAAGTVVTGDKITLYVSSTRYSDPTTVGSTMTFTNDLDADDAPYYTRTNTNGHESKLSVADGVILELYSAVATNTGSINVLEAGDTIILKFGSSGTDNVIVTEKIYLPHISWVTSGSSLFGGDDTTALADSATSASSVTLMAFAGYADIDTDETVKFNIETDIPIVDATGKNRVLPFAVGSEAEFDSSSF